MFQWYLLMLCTPGQGALLFTGCRALLHDLANFGEIWKDLLKDFDFIFHMPMIE